MDPGLEREDHGPTRYIVQNFMKTFADNFGQKLNKDIKINKDNQQHRKKQVYIN